jgi:hypothetical protein
LQLLATREKPRWKKISQESLAHAVIRNLLERLGVAGDEFLSIDDEILRNMIDQGEKK